MSNITVIIPNKTHAFPINVKGDVVSNENSGTDIFALVGTQKATPVDEISGPLEFTISVVANNMFSGLITKDIANKKFTMSDIDGSSIGIVSDLPTVIDLNSENAASFKNIPLVRGELQFIVNVSDQDGVIHEKIETCVYTKARSLFTTETIFIEVGTRLRASADSVLDPEGIKEIISFKWSRNGEEIAGQTSNTYNVINEDVGSEITAVLTYIDGKNRQKSVVAIGNVFVVDSAPINFPIITGIPESAQTLTADTSFIFDRNTVATSFEYDWLVDDVSSGITTQTYSLASGELDVGKTLKVQVTYTDGADIVNTLVSPSVTIRDSAAGDSVVIFGTPSLGQTLQASLQTSDGTTPTILSYEWRRNGRIIDGATSSSYKVKRADVNSFISATVEYDTGSGAVKYKTSGNVNFQNSSTTGEPVLNKVLEDGSESSDLNSGVSVGTLLKADVSSIADGDDIKDFYYPFDSLVSSDLVRDNIEHEAKIAHNVINVTRSSKNQVFFETSDEIVLDQEQPIQSIYVDNSLGNSSDIIYVQYQENGAWKNALQVEGKASRFFLLDENIVSANWRLSFIASSSDATLSSYTFDANWSLECPSIESTRKFIYQWQRIDNGIVEDIIGARKQTYLISQNDLNCDVGVKVSFIDGADKIVSLESSKVFIENYSPTGRVNIEGIAKVGSTLTAKPDLYDRDNITAENALGKVETFDSYQWYLDGVALQGQTLSTLLLTSAMQTKSVSVEVTYTDFLNAQHTVRSRFPKKVNASPTGGVQIFGTPKVGRTLSINTSNLKDLNNFNQLFYQWFLVDSGVETQIQNAALQDYVVRAGDVGKSLRANVYYTDNDGFQELVSTNTVSILDSETTGKPSISGIAVAGSTVTANVANITDENGIASYAYQWRIDEVNVDSATFSSFTISADDNGQYGNFLDLVVTVTDNAGNQKTLYSDPARIALAAGTIGPDGGTIQGENVSLTLQSSSLSQETVIYIYETVTSENVDLPEGSTLVGTPWAFTPHGLTFEQPITIQFEVPEGTNLVLRADDENDNTFEIVENYSISNTTATLQTNTFSVYVGSVFTPAVITGTPEQGSYLTASVSGDVTDVTFQWRRNGENILAAQGSTYLVTLEDVGQMITVAATFTDVNSVSTTKVSAEVEIINTPAQGQIVVNGSRRVGVTLESEIVSLVDINTVDSSTYSYQWYRNSVAIPNATLSTYEVVQDDFLKDLTVKVSFIDGAGKAETVESEEVFISKKGSVFFTTNSRKQGDTLTVDTSMLNDFYALFNRTFTWYADGQPIDGSNSNNRQLTTFESGKTIKSVFTYTDGRGTNETLETEERFIYTISATVTPAGGVFSNQGVTLNVPAGAVDQNVDILVYVVPYDQAQLPIGTLTDQVGYAFTPLDLSFNVPVTITLPKPNDEYDMVLYGTNSSVEEFAMQDEDFITVDSANNKISIQADNFGVFISAILYVRVDIVGVPEQGQVLDTIYTGEVFSKTYQWYRGEVPIAGETGTSYTVTLEDVGEEIKVVSTYLLEETSSPEVVESEPVLIVNSLPVADTSVIISGQDRVGETLTAIASGISDANNPGGLSGFLYQWRVDGVEISGQTNETFVIQSSHFQKNISVEITYVDAAGILESVISDDFFISRIPPSGYVEVIGTPEVDEYLEVDTDNLVDLNGIGEFSYQWRVNGVDLVGETNSTLLVTSAMEDKAISVVLSYTDGVGEVETVTSRNALIIDADPTGAVVIDYTILEVAQTLTANTSTIADANQVGTFSYQWKSNGNAIAGATNKTYVVANQFCNTNITVTVTYVDGDGYIESLTSEPVTIVNSPVQGLPTVSGNPDVSATLTINTTALSDVNILGTFNYKWFADGVEIAGATEKTWVVSANSYVGKTITGQVYYTDGAGNNEQVNTSNGITIQNSLPTGKPTISGTLQVGQTLTVVSDAISDFNVIVEPFYYQWYANGVAIQDATGSDYVVRVGDINKNITVRASFYDEGNTLETTISDNYKIINTPATGYVEILHSGDLEVHGVLTASVNIQDDNVIISDFSYQWKRDGQPIIGLSTSQEYIIQNADWGKDISVTVSFTDTGGTIESIDSINSINMINSEPVGSVVIEGSNKVGEIVSVNLDNITEKNVAYKYPLNDSLSSVSISGLSDNWGTTTNGSINGKKAILALGRPANGVTVYVTFTTQQAIRQINLQSWNGGYGHQEMSYVNVYYYETNGWNFLGRFDLATSVGAGVQSYDLSETVTSDRFHVTFYNYKCGHGQIVGLAQLVAETGEIIGEYVPQYNTQFQWYRDGVLIEGATEQNYTTTFDDLYKTLTVDVSYTDGSGNIEIPQNNASFLIENSPPEGTVLIAGTRNVGESLYFTHNVVDRDNITAENPIGEVTFTSFQWYQSDSEDGALTPITEATGSTLLLTPELQAKWIALDATYIDIEGDDETIHASNRLPVKSVPTGNAVITSTDLQVGRQLFLDTSTIADLNDLGEFSYQWYRTDGSVSTAIEGAIQTHYSFQPADLGYNIYCIVSYVDGDGDAEIVVSNQLGPVVEATTSVGTVSITNNVEIGGTIESDLENILVMNNFETVAPVVAYNFHEDARDTSPNLLHLVGNNYSFDAEGGLDLSKSTSAYLRTQGTTPVLNNDTHTIAFRVKMIGGTSNSGRKVFSFGRSSTNDGTPEIWWGANTKKLLLDYNNAAANYCRTTELEPDTWYDVMFVKQGNVGRVYVDGILVQTNTSLPNPKSTGNYRLDFGGNSSYQTAPVIIKDFQIFDFAVDAYTSASNYPFYTEPTLSLQWKADGAPIAGETGSVYQVPADNNQLAKDITLEVSFLDALGNAKVIESNSSVVVESDLQGELILEQDGMTITDIQNSTSIILDGESFSDYTNNKNIVNVYGNTTLSSLQKKFGNTSYYFDGIGDYLSINYSSNWALAKNNFTIEFWIYPQDMADTYQGIIGQNDFQFIAMQFNEGSANGKMTIWMDTNGSSGWNFNKTSNTVFSNNQWYHVALTRNGDNVKLFVNGQEDWSETFTGTIYTNPSVPLYIGRSQLSGRWLKGHIDDFRIINGYALYTDSFSVPTESVTTQYIRTLVGTELSVDTSGVTDLNGLVSTEYQWYADNSPILDATGSSYIITQEEINKDIRVKAVFEDGTGRKSPRLSNEVPIVNTPMTGSVTITSTGTFEIGHALLANAFIVDENGIESIDYSYQWYRDGAVLSGEVGRTYIIKNVDIGKQLSVRASFVDKGKTIESIKSSPVTILDSTYSGQALIQGLPKVGSILSIDTSGLSDPNGITSLSYQWKQEGNEILGATSQTYTVTPSDYNKNITATVTYVDGVGNITTLSNLQNVYIVRAAALGNITIEGIAKILSTLTAVDTITDLDGLSPFNYQWYLNGKAIEGAISSTFQIPYGYEAQNVHVVVSYVETLEDGSLEVETIVSPSVEVNANPFGKATVSGTPKKGQQLTASTSQISDTNGLGLTADFQWQREVSPNVYQDIGGATNVRYTPTNSDVEKNIRVQVTYIDLAGFVEQVYSDKVYVENSLPTGIISFSGTRKTENTIVASISNISDANGIASIPEYQWKLDGEILVGETGNSYTIASSDVGKELSLQLTYTDGIGIIEVEEQSAGIIEDTQTSGTVSITGNFVLNGTITADTSGLVDADGIANISYQWISMGQKIPGATSQNYILNDNDIRKFNISVEVSVVDNNGMIKTFSTTKWFDEGAMVATYKWYHFDDLEHIINFQADDHLVTKNLQLHLDANDPNNFDGAIWKDMSSNSLEALMYNNFDVTTGSYENISSTYSQDIATYSQLDIAFSNTIPEQSYISGTVQITLDAYENYYSMYRGVRTIYNDREYNTDVLDFYLVSPDGKEFLIKSGNFSRNSVFNVNVGEISAKGTWKVAIKAARGMFDSYSQYNYSYNRGYYSYTRYLKSEISFTYNTLDGNTQTYSEQGYIDGYKQQQGYVQSITQLAGNYRALNPAEQITLETFVYRDNWSDSNYNQFIAGKQGYELYLDISNNLVFSINGVRTTNLNITRLKLSGWNHIAATYDGVSTKIYINGQLRQAGNWSNNIRIQTILDPLYVGSNGNFGTLWDGKLGSFRLYDRTLTREEILSNYNYELNRNTLTEKTYALQQQDTYLATNGKVGSYNTGINTEYTRELRGYFKPLNTGTYTFYVYGSDKGYLWVGNKAIDRISTSNADIVTTSSSEFSFSIKLEADTAYAIRFIAGNSYVNNNTSTARLQVSGPSLSKTSSLQNYLFGGDAAWKYWNTQVENPIYLVEDFESDWSGTYGFDFSGVSEPWNVISQYGLNMNATYTGTYRWDSIPQMSFDDNIEFSLEETFEDASWTGPTRFDWTDVENPVQIISQFGIGGYTSFGDDIRVKWTDVESIIPTFNRDTIVEENFDDDSWTGYTRIDWRYVESPASVGSTYSIQGYWIGSHDWANNPNPQFGEDKFVTSEQFDDTSWTGFTRIDWTGVDDPIAVIAGKDFSAHWEGQFKWSEREQPSFSEKSLALEEDFEEDWTI
jgi:hypothetical protein